MPVIAHNIASQFTNRQLNITTNKKTKSAEKLASGYKINRSADDAAGLQISEKMRSQIRGLNQASRNIQDGISLCQVADGALNESHAVLQRMRELSVQAANDTNSDEDRKAIQQEIDQLTKEVDRIANDTSFNEDIYPLNQKSNVTDGLTGTSNLWRLPSTLMESTATIKMAYPNEVGIVNGVTLTGTNTATIKTIGVYYNGQKKGNIMSNGIGMIPIKDNTLNDGMEVHDISMSDLNISDNGSIYIINNGKKIYLELYTDGKAIQFGGSYTQLQDKYTNLFGKQVENLIWGVPQNMDANTSKTSGRLWIQSGANTGEGLFLSLVDATAKGIGITDPNVSVMSEEDCDDAMNRLDDAIQTVSSYRSQFGAYQNRLECAKAVDDNTSENTQYAESRIRDTDMAEEMVEHSKNNILEQVGQSMLAQANQSTQGILSLLG